MHGVEAELRDTVVMADVQARMRMLRNTGSHHCREEPGEQGTVALPMSCKHDGHAQGVG